MLNEGYALIAHIKELRELKSYIDINMKLGGLPGATRYAHSPILYKHFRFNNKYNQRYRENIILVRIELEYNFVNYSSVVVDVDANRMYFGWDFRKAFTFRLTLFYDYEEYKKRLKRGEDVSYILRIYGLKDEASASEIEEAFGVYTADCKKLEESINKNQSYVVNSYFSDDFCKKFKINKDNLKYLPLLAIDYKGNSFYWVGSKKKGGIAKAIYPSLSTFQAEDYKAGILDAGSIHNFYPLHSFGYKIVSDYDDEVDWNSLG